MEKRGRGEEGLYEKRKGKKCEFKNLILRVLAVSMDREMDGGLRERAEAEGERGKKREKRGEKGGEKEKKEGGEEMGELIRYLEEIKK